MALSRLEDHRPQSAATDAQVTRSKCARAASVGSESELFHAWDATAFDARCEDRRRNGFKVVFIVGMKMTTSVPGW